MAQEDLITLVVLLVGNHAMGIAVCGALLYDLRSFEEGIERRAAARTALVSLIGGVGPVLLYWVARFALPAAGRALALLWRTAFPAKVQALPKATAKERD